MLIKLSKNSFVRIYDNGEVGYIFSQLTRHDRCYINSGVDLLSALSRTPKDREQFISELVQIYNNADVAIVKRDLNDMLDSLIESKFVVQGNTTEDVEANDISFSYGIDNPKTLVEDYSQETSEFVDLSTETFYLTHDQNTPRLSSIQFELTSRCNERCIHCYIPNGKKNHGFDMPLGKVKDIIAQFAAMGGLLVTLSGGEALMHRDIAEIMRYCRQKDLQISLLTNLALLKDDLIPVMQEVNLSIVQTSLYSMNPDIHDYITTIKGSWAKTVDAILKLYRANVPVQISCPVMKANKSGYDRVMKFAQSLNMKAQTDYIMMAQSDLDTQNLANRISIDETEILIKDIIANDINYKELVDNITPFSSISEEEFANMPLCGVGLNQICVTSNGDLYPCAGWQANILGNVFKDSLKNVWENSEGIKELRAVTRKDFPKCLKCEARDYCSMCMARNYNESNGDMFAPPAHTCDVAFLNKRLAEETFKRQ